MSNIETPTPPNELAGSILAQLRTAMQSIPGYGFVTRGQRRRLSPAATVPDAFLLTVARAVETMPEIAAAAKLQAAELRDLVTYSNAYSAVAAEMELAARGLRETIATRRADIGVRALQAYKMAQAFDRSTERELVVPHVTAMRRALGRGRPPRQPRPAVTPPVSTIT